MTTPTRYIPLTEVADRLNLCQDAAARRAREGCFGSPIRLGKGNGRLLVPEAGFDAFVKRARVAVAPKAAK